MKDLCNTSGSLDYRKVLCNLAIRNSHRRKSDGREGGRGRSTVSGREEGRYLCWWISECLLCSLCAGQIGADKG